MLSFNLTFTCIQVLCNGPDLMCSCDIFSTIHVGRRHVHLYIKMLPILIFIWSASLYSTNVSDTVHRYYYYNIIICASSVYIVSWRVPHVGQEMLFRNTRLRSLWGVHDFTHSLYIHYCICQSLDYVYGLMTGLFAWISQTALSVTYLIIVDAWIVNWMNIGLE